jgi:drug/metabolite transporter (DMT)-like permease
MSGRLSGVLAVLFAVTMWGMVPVATRFLVHDVPPQFVMIFRVVPAGIIGLVVAIALGARAMPWRAWARLTIAAVIGNVGYQVLSIYGTQFIPAGWTGMLFGLEPVFIAFFAVVLAGDRLTPWLVAGMVLALCGTAALMLGNAIAPAKDVALFGIVLVTLGTMGWGIYTVMVRPVSAQYGATEVASLSLGISAFPVLLFVTPDLPHVIASLTALQWATIGFIVIFCTFFGTVAWNYALGHMSSALAGMFLYVQPIVAALGGVILLGERLSFTLLVGGGMIIAGVALAQFGPAVAARFSRNRDLPNSVHPVGYET